MISIANYLEVKKPSKVSELAVTPQFQLSGRLLPVDNRRQLGKNLIEAPSYPPKGTNTYSGAKAVGREIIPRTLRRSSDDIAE